MVKVADAGCFHADLTSVVTRILAGDRRPPSLQAAELDSSDRATRILDGDQTAHTARARMAAVLNRCDAVERRVELETLPPVVGCSPSALQLDGERPIGCEPPPVKRAVQRVAVDAVKLPSGAVLVTRGRMLRADWLADPKRLGRALDLCGSAAGVHMTQAGDLGEHVKGCNTLLCPVCGRRRARARADKWAPVIKRLATRYTLANWTMTQQAHMDGIPDGLELVSGYNQETPGLAGVSSHGETLLEALDRLRSTFDGLRYNRATRRWWNRHVVAFVLGLEWTCKTTNGRRRWHVHGHCLLVLDVEPGDLERCPLSSSPTGNVQYRGRFWDELRSSWCANSPGAQWSGQHLSVVDDVDDCIREVLKYPCKPAEMNPAQLAEALVTTKGRQFHSPGGGLHAASAVGKAARSLLDPDAVRDDYGMTWDVARLPPRRRVAAQLIAQGIKDRDEQKTPIGIGMRRRRYSAVVETTTTRRRGYVQRVAVLSVRDYDDLTPDRALSALPAEHADSDPGRWADQTTEGDGGILRDVRPEGRRRPGTVVDDAGVEWEPVHLKDLARLVSLDVDAMDFAWYWPPGRYPAAAGDEPERPVGLVDAGQLRPAEILAQLARWRPAQAA